MSVHVLSPRPPPPVIYQVQIGNYLEKHNEGDYLSVDKLSRGRKNYN